MVVNPTPPQQEHRRRRSCRILYQTLPSSLLDACKQITTNAITEELNLFQNNIGEDGAAAVARALRENQTVAKVCLGWNAIGSVGVTELVHEHSLVNVQELFLESNGIGDSGATALGSALSKLQCLKRLVLQGNSIGRAGGSALAAGLAQNSTLQELVLSSNLIGCNGTMAFGRALTKNKSLRILDLERNRVGADGVIVLANCLARDNTTLETLRLYGNSIGNNGAAAIKTLMESNQTIQELDLAVNEITKAGAIDIAEGLQHNTGLNRLELYGNDIELAGAVALKQTLASGANKELLCLIIGGFEEPYRSEQKEIDYYCERNQAGWRFVGSRNLSASLWPHLFSKLSRKPSLLYGFLREKPELFINKDESGKMKSNSIITSGRSKKRSRDEISSV